LAATSGPRHQVAYITLSSDDESMSSPTAKSPAVFAQDVGDAPEAASSGVGGSVVLGKRVRVERKLDEVPATVLFAIVLSSI
jgi:hypothetical protein